MEWTTEQQTEINKLVEEATNKAKEGLFDEESTNKKVQSESDKVRTEYSKKMKTLEDELIKYKPKEKSPADIELENRLKILEDKEKEVSKKEKLLNVTNKLNEQGLPSELAKYLQGTEDLETEMNSLKEIFNNLKVDGSYKPDNHSSKKDSITKEQFMKMNYTERINLYNTNKDLYDRLSK